jgi:hypothetical protein
MDAYRALPSAFVDATASEEIINRPRPPRLT